MYERTAGIRLTHLKCVWSVAQVWVDIVYGCRSSQCLLSMCSAFGRCKNTKSKIYRPRLTHRITSIWILFINILLLLRIWRCGSALLWSHFKFSFVDDIDDDDICNTHLPLRWRKRCGETRCQLFASRVAIFQRESLAETHTHAHTLQTNHVSQDSY